MTNSELFICSECESYLLNQSSSGPSTTSSLEKEGSAPICTVCLGLWQPKYAKLQLERALESSCAPYGGVAANRFATLLNHAPTISICGDLMIRYNTLGADAQYNRKKLFATYLQDLKSRLNQLILDLIQEKQNGITDIPVLSNDEQQGYLSLHLLCIPPKGTSLTSGDHVTGKKRKRQKPRPFVTQGGDPRLNLESRLQNDGYQWLAMSEATDHRPVSSIPLAEQATNDPQSGMEFHVCVFRRPIFVYGYYTKCRRDISQTPFVVDGKPLGQSSVEEQICGPIIEALGVSERNNVPNSNVKYGMCKFHASGREDMDVRMMIRPNTDLKGRPFCVQVIDALRPFRSEADLQKIVEAVNSGNGETSESWHGSNPMGVGISQDFRLVPSEAFSGLQGDTETKIKHYGCHCWSESVLADDWTLPKDWIFPLKIQQKTPLRVLHRRANLVRERQIVAAHAVRLDDHHFRLELSTQAGTYVKEFVHGDLRRTSPSLSSLLGIKTNLLLLDCEGIDTESMED